MFTQCSMLVIYIYKRKWVRLHVHFESQIFKKEWHGGVFYF